LGSNPGSYSLQGTNTYLVGTGSSRILIDTGEGKRDYLTTLKEGMRQAGCTSISQIVVSHWHHDHLGGVSSVLEDHGSNIPV
jgi:glyoxylase-like metal-dependent hydrolase (beta-lactamase superfamily II)